MVVMKHCSKLKMGTETGLDTLLLILLLKGNENRPQPVDYRVTGFSQFFKENVRAR